MHRPRDSGQAAVETALILPLQLFTLLGALQMGLAYQARLVNEYAAYKTARAASLYRVECQQMKDAALMALLPTVSRLGRATGGGNARVANRFVKAAQVLMAANNRPPNNPEGASTPLVHIDWRLTDARPEFDEQLDPGEAPMKVHVRLAYFFEYRIPFANWVLTRFWLQTQTGLQLYSGIDPIMAVHQNRAQAVQPTVDAELVGIAQRAIVNKYFTIPIVSTFSLRMMSDPLPGLGSTHCD
jgi:hypothetical protein